MIVVGIIFLVICWVINLIIGRRKFYRRNQAGVEEFESYGKAVGTNLFEGALTKIATGIGVVGIIMIIIGWINYFAMQ